jgi:hypothetical protein
MAIAKAKAKFATPLGPAKLPKSHSALAADNGPDQLAFACQRKAQRQHVDGRLARS